MRFRPSRCSCCARDEFSPASLGPIFSWVKGDNASLDEGVIYDSLTDSGSVGGSFVAATNAHPVAVEVGGKTAPVFQGRRRGQHNSAASNWSWLTDGTSAKTLTLRFYNYESPAPAQARIFNTGQLASTVVGFDAWISSDKVQVRWSNGSGTWSAILTSNVTLAGGWHTLQVVKNGTSVSLSVDGETAVSGVIASPTMATPHHSPTVGNYSSGGGQLKGLIPELTIHSSALDAAGLAQMRAYMADRWSATPEYSHHQEGDVAIHLRSNVGVTIATGVSAWRDLSGYNNDVTQVTPSLQPSLTAAGLNGLPVVDGDGAELMDLATFTQGEIAQPNTTYVAGRWPSSGIYVMDGRALGKRNALLEQGGNAAIFAGASLIIGTAPTDDAPFISRAVYNGAASKGRIQESGASEMSATGDAGTEAMNGLTIFASRALSSLSDGSVGEIVIFDGVAGDDTAASDAVQGDLSARLDITPT